MQFGDLASQKAPGILDAQVLQPALRASPCVLHLSAAPAHPNFRAGGDFRRQNGISGAGAGPGLCSEHGDSFRKRCGFVNGL